MITAACKKSASAKTDLTYLAPDFAAANHMRTLEVSISQIWEISQVLSKMAKTTSVFAENPSFTPFRPVPIADPIAEKYPLSPRAEVSLHQLASKARGRLYLKEIRDAQEVKNLGNFPKPREPGVAPLSENASRDPKEVAHAKRLAKEMHHVRDLEEALANARARLEKMTCKS